MNYNETPSFKKDFEKLKKKFKTLDDDLSIAKKNAIELFHIHKIDNQSVVLIPGIPSEKFRFYKMRKFACKSLKGRGVQSGIRIIYSHDIANNTITFIEIYFKAAQLSENKHRIEDFLKEFS